MEEGLQPMLWQVIPAEGQKVPMVRLLQNPEDQLQARVHALPLPETEQLQKQQLQTKFLLKKEGEQLTHVLLPTKTVQHVPRVIHAREQVQIPELTLGQVQVLRTGIVPNTHRRE